MRQLQTTHRRKPDSTQSEKIVISEALVKVLSSDQVTTPSNYDNLPEATKNTFIKVDEGKEIRGWYQEGVKQIPGKPVHVVWGPPEHSLTEFDTLTNVQTGEVKHNTNWAWQPKAISQTLDEKGVVVVSYVQEFASLLFQVENYTSPQVYEAEEVKHWYQEELSKILEVKQIVYKQQGEKRIEFIVAVDRIRRKLSHQLSQVEFQLYNKYTDWFFDFKHSGIQTFSQWSLDGYANLYSRD